MSISTITILGGGTSGWLSAAYLTEFLERLKLDISIAVIESPDIGIIGVGEATIPNLCHTLSQLGIREKELMKATNATFKQGIKFCNWLHDPKSHPDEHFFHPFQPPQPVHGYDFASIWNVYARTDGPLSFADAASHQPIFCQCGVSPKKEGDPEYIHSTAYAYHLDAVKLGQYLRDYAIKRGVKHIQQTIRDAAVDETGNIQHLISDDGDTFPADLFIDCSGFRSLLLQQHLKEPFIDFSDRLLCNRAVAIQIPHAEDINNIHTYTTSQAKSSGWIWNIQLSNRSGNGYVYGSDFLTKDRAEAELRAHLGPAAQDQPARHIEMRIGRSARSWVGNCIGIGLSGGFVEPLESTGIYLVERALEVLVNHFPRSSDFTSARNRFNTSMSEEYSDIADFITMHYCLTEREDTEFWRANKYDLTIPASLSERLDLWQTRPPKEPHDSRMNSPMSPHNWAYILAGMGKLSNHVPEVLRHASIRKIHEIVNTRHHMWGQNAQDFPSHIEYLKKS